MKRTKEYFEKRVQRLTNMLRPEVKESLQISLSCYTPGKDKLYQIQILQKETGNEIMSFPRFGHCKGTHFDPYLEGLLDGIEECPYFGRK